MLHIVCAMACNLWFDNWNSIYMAPIAKEMLVVCALSVLIVVSTCLSVLRLIAHTSVAIFPSSFSS